LVSCVGWTSNNELFSISDDKQILRWSGDGDLLGTVSKFDIPSKEQSVFATDMAWSPVAPGKGQNSADTFVVAASDGSLSSCRKLLHMQQKW
jgi:intraflagellar transport protein 80